MIEKDLAWSAGIYEGEGCPCVGTSNGRKTFRIEIDNTDYSLLQEMERIWKGKTRKLTKNYKDGYNRKEVWRWILAKQHGTKNFCRLVYPYMRTEVKIKQLEEAWISRGWDVTYLKSPINKLID